MRDKIIPITKPLINLPTMAALDSGGLMLDPNGISTCAEIAPKVAHTVKKYSMAKLLLKDSKICENAAKTIRLTINLRLFSKSPKGTSNIKPSP